MGNSISPKMIVMRFPSRLCGDSSFNPSPQYWTESFTVEDVEFPGAQQTQDMFRPGTEVFHSDAPALFQDLSDTPSNQGQLQALVMQFSTDLLSWNFQNFDINYIGIVGFVPNGIYDEIIFTYRSDLVETRTTTPQYFRQPQQLGHQVPNLNTACPDISDSRISAAVPCITVFGPPVANAGMATFSVFSICKQNDRLIKTFLYSIQYQCGCTAPEVPCLNCCICLNTVCPNAKFSALGTATDANGVHTIAANYTDGIWYSGWIPFTTVIATSGMTPTGYEKCLNYITGISYYYIYIKCVGDTLTAGVFVPGAECSNFPAIGIILLPYLFTEEDLITPPNQSTLTGFKWETTGIIPSSCSPMTVNFTLPPNFLAPPPPVTTVNFSIPVDPDTEGRSCCLPCPIPSSGLCLSYESPIFGNGSVALIQSDASTWQSVCIPPEDGTIGIMFILNCSGYNQGFNPSGNSFLIIVLSSGGSSITPCAGPGNVIYYYIELVNGTPGTGFSLTCDPFDFIYNPEFNANRIFSRIEIKVDPTCSTAAICSPCNLPSYDLCLYWSNTVTGDGYAVLTYDDTDGTYSTGCISYGNFQSFSATVSCDGGVISFDIEGDEDSTLCMDTRTYSIANGDLIVDSIQCAPLDIIYTVLNTTPLFLFQNFTQFEIIGGICNPTVPCSPCAIPPLDLTVSWTGPIGAGSLALLPIAGGHNWVSFCVPFNYGQIGGALAITFACSSNAGCDPDVGGNCIYLIVQGNTLSYSCDTTVFGYFGISSLDLTGFDQTAIVCTPLSISYVATPNSLLWFLGFRTFTVTM